MFENVKRFVRRALSSTPNQAWLRGEVWEGLHAATGDRIDAATILNSSAVWRCINLLSTAAGRLPIHHFVDVGNRRERLRGSDLEMLLNFRPNDMMSGVTMRELLVNDLLRYGNAIFRIERIGTRPARLVHWFPTRVRVEIESDELLYTYTDPDQRTTTVDAGEVWHVRNLSDDGVIGWSPVRFARESIGMDLASLRYGGAYYRNGAVPRVALRHPGNLSPQAEKNIRESWTRLYSGSNAHGTAVLDEGMEVQTIAAQSHADAQWLEGRKFSVVEIARWFGVPPHLLYDLDRATFSNISEQGREFLMYSLQPYLKRIEDSAKLSLIRQRDWTTQHLEHETKALVSPDIQTRFSAYSTALGGAPFMTVNELRAAENLPPVEGGDVVARPVNMTERNDDDQGDGSDAEPAPPNEPPGSESDDLTAREGLWDAFCQSWNRLRRRELGQYEKASKDDKTFLDAVEQIAEKQGELVAGEMAGLLRAAKAVGTGSRELQSQLDLTKQSMLDVYDSTPREAFAVEVAKRCAQLGVMKPDDLFPGVRNAIFKG